MAVLRGGPIAGRQRAVSVPSACRPAGRRPCRRRPSVCLAPSCVLKPACCAMPAVIPAGPAMKLVVLCLVVAVAAVAAVGAVDTLLPHLPVYGAPLVGVRYGDQPADGLSTQEALGWRTLYDAPFLLALQQEGRNELVVFLVKDGLRSLPLTEDRLLLHSFLLSGPEKVGVLLSGSNFVSLPEVDMPITRFVMPTGFSLAESARLHADFYSFPTLLIVRKSAMSAQNIARLALVGDFTILPDAIRVSQDVPAPAAKWAKRFTTAYQVNSNTSPALNPFGPKN